MKSKRCRKCSKLVVNGRTMCAYHLEYARNYQRNYRPRYKDYFKNRYAANREDILKQDISFILQLRMEVIKADGGKCACCGDSHLEFLCVDHIYEDGAEHRKKLFGKSAGGAGTKFYRWLKVNGFPSGFQLLCWNCNSSKHIYGGCPHQQETNNIHGT